MDGGVVGATKGRRPTNIPGEIVEVFHEGREGGRWVGWYHGCGARPVKISSQARISASPAARQREEIAADRVVRGWRVQPGLSVNRGQSGGRRWMKRRGEGGE